MSRCLHRETLSGERSETDSQLTHNHRTGRAFPHSQVPPPAPGHPSLPAVVPKTTSREGNGSPETDPGIFVSQSKLDPVSSPQQFQPPAQPHIRVRAGSQARPPGSKQGARDQRSPTHPTTSRDRRSAERTPRLLRHSLTWT